jgi:hypothetical protein
MTRQNSFTVGRFPQVARIMPVIMICEASLYAGKRLPTIKRRKYNFDRKGFIELGVTNA